MDVFLKDALCDLSLHTGLYDMKMLQSKRAPGCCQQRMKGEEKGITLPFLEMWTEPFTVGEGPQQLCHCCSEMHVGRSLL